MITIDKLTEQRIDNELARRVVELEEQLLKINYLEDTAKFFTCSGKIIGLLIAIKIIFTARVDSLKN